MKKGLNEFYTALGEKEAHGDYKEFNDYDYLGKYQMGEAALVDTGYYVDDHINYSGKCDWKGTFTGKDGVYSRDDFLSNPQAQENANKEYKKIEWNQLKSYNADKFLGKKVKGILITQSGLLAAAHLKGAKGTADCIKNPNSKSCNPNDAYGTSIYDYLEEFAGYDISEITGLPSDAFDFPEEENQKSDQKQPEQREDKNNQIQEKQEPQKSQFSKTKQKNELSPEELEKAVDKEILRIFLGTIIYGLHLLGEQNGNIEDSKMTLIKVLKMVAKNNNMKLSDLVDYIYNKIIELDTYEQNKYMMKYLNQVPIQQNLKSQAQKPINMNFAELIRQPQTAAADYNYEQFNPARIASVNKTPNINYGKNVTKYNTIKLQNEKNPTLYKGSNPKTQSISTNSGNSILNTANTFAIPQIEYNNLPKFDSLRVELDTSPISSSNIIAIAQNQDGFLNTNIENSSQDDDILGVLFNIVKQKKSQKNKG